MKALRGSRAGLIVVLGLLSWSTARGLARSVVVLEEFLSGLDRPIAVKNADDGSGRLFVLERAGRIRVIREGALLPTPFLDISDRVDTIGEGGLMGLAFHPDFPVNQYFFVNYTASPAGAFRVVVSRFSASQDSPDQADPQEEVLLEIEQETLIHNAGELVFGPDGYLYISVGDGGFVGTVGDVAQDLSSLSGKILRIDIDQQPYGIPLDNPFVDMSDARGEIWAYGFRNPFRMSIDRLTGRLYAGDVGERHVEEVDLVVRGGNYGWPKLEGDQCFPPSLQDCDRDGLVAPIAVYNRGEGQSVIGGLVYRGKTSTGLWGSYLFSDFVSKRVWEIREVSEGRFRRRQVGLLGMLAASWGKDEAGEIFIPGLQNGKIFKVLFSWFENHAQVVSGVFGDVRMTTRFDLHNLSDQPLKGVIRFLDPAGQPSAVWVDGVLTADFALELAGQESSSVTLDPDRNRFQGWALTLTDGTLSSSVHFLQEQARAPDPLPVSTVAASTWSRQARIYVVQDDFLSAAFAVVNPWSEPANVVVSLPDNPELAVLELDPLHQVVFHLASMEGFPLHYEGPVVIESDEEIAITSVATVGGQAVSGLAVVAP